MCCQYFLGSFWAHYRISKLCRVSVTLGKGQVTLGKVFAECNTRQTTLGKESHGNADFAECRITGTRQRICRVPWHSANKPRGATPGPALCRVSNGRHSAKVEVLPSVLVRHSAKSARRGGPPCGRFAECWIMALGKVPASGCGHVAILPSAGTRQTCCAADLGRPLCRVFWLKHSAKW